MRTEIPALLTVPEQAGGAFGEGRVLEGIQAAAVPDPEIDRRIPESVREVPFNPETGIAHQLA